MNIRKTIISIAAIFSMLASFNCENSYLAENALNKNLYNAESMKFISNDGKFQSFQKINFVYDKNITFSTKSGDLFVRAFYMTTPVIQEYPGAVVGTSVAGYVAGQAKKGKHEGKLVWYPYSAVTFDIK